MGSHILGVGITGLELTELERRLLRESPPYAVVLFGRNVKTAEQLRALCAEIKATADPSPLIMIDQEGGRVDRLRNLIPGFPSAEAFSEGERGEELAHWMGRVIGEALRYFDIDVNLAPVVDVQRDEPVKGLERRCFGKTPEEVNRLAGAFMRGHHGAGSAVCLKHFPGIGKGSGDPHYGATVIDIPEEELVAVDLQPYVRLADEAAAVMIGHGSYPQIEPVREPASLSWNISTRLLRDVVRFRGLAVSDDMEMHAVSDLGTFEEIGERALIAGNDIILFCSQIERIPDIVSYLGRRKRERPEIRARYDEAMARGEAFREHCARLREGVMSSRASVGGREGRGTSQASQMSHEARALTFDDILAEMESFCEAFRSSRYDDVDRADVERRKSPRSGGTGRTGREEWT